MKRDASGRERLLISPAPLAITSLEVHAALQGGATVALRHEQTVAPESAPGNPPGSTGWAGLSSPLLRADAEHHVLSMT
jgi:hypothetical protein